MSGNVSRILKILSLTDKSVIGIYLVGSRLWGTDTERSDFDILIIIEDLPTAVLKSYHKNQYDMTLLTKSEFVEKIKQGSLIEIICCLIKGDEVVWYAKELMKHRLPAIDVLKAWVSERNTLDYEKAKKFWVKDRKEAALKILQHIITATLVTRELRRKADIAGHLSQVTLDLWDLRALVEKGRASDDRIWLTLPWLDVEVAHRIRVRNIDHL